MRCLGEESIVALVRKPPGGRSGGESLLRHAGQKEVASRHRAGRWGGQHAHPADLVMRTWQPLVRRNIDQQ